MGSNLEALSVTCRHSPCGFLLGGALEVGAGVGRGDGYRVLVAGDGLRREHICAHVHVDDALRHRVRLKVEEIRGLKYFIFITFLVHDFNHKKNG